MPGEADLLWNAQVIDDTLTFFQRFDDNLERIADASEKQFNTVEKSAQDAGKTIGLVGGIVGGVAAKITQMGMQAVAAIKNFISSSIQLRARVDTLGVSLKQVGNTAGLTDEEIAKLEADVKSMGITTQATRQNLLRMAQANLDMSKASELARVAQNAAVIAGVNSSEAFQRILYGIQTLQPEMLRNLGLTVNLQAAYSEWAAQAGKTTKDLTGQQKQMIAMNAVIKASEQITGTYEAAMGSAGKQAASMERHVEELQLAIGEAFQPAYSQQIGFMTEQLKMLREWFEENQEQVQQFAEVLSTVISKLFELAKGLIEFVAAVPGHIEEAGAVLAKTLGKALDVASPEEIEERRSKLGEYFGQAVSLLAGYINSFLKVISEGIGIATDAVKGWLQTFGILEGESADTFEALDARIENFGDTILTTFNDTIMETGQMLGVIEEIPEALDDAADSAKGAKSEFQKLSESLAVVRNEFKQLAAKMEEEAAKKAIKEARDAEREALRLSHKIEDIERKHVDRIEAAREKAASARQDLLEKHGEQEQDLAKRQAEEVIEAAKDAADERIDIERNFRRTIQDIADDFAYAAEDAARKNDAITLLRLMRDKKRQIEEAQKAKDREREDTKVDTERKTRDLKASLEKERAELDADFQDRLEKLDKNLEQQLIKADEQRLKDIENLQRTLVRQQQMKDLARKFEEEDRRKAFDKQLMDYAEQFAQLEGLTQSGLDNMLAEWEKYFGDMTVLSERFSDLRTQAATPPPVYETGRGGRVVDVESGDIIGQAGQVSQLLSPAARPVPMTVPQMAVPSVAPRKSFSRQEISFSGDVSGLDPYLQRMLITGLLEIERNRG